MTIMDIIQHIVGELMYTSIIVALLTITAGPAGIHMKNIIVAGEC